MDKIFAIYDFDVTYTTRFMEYFKKRTDLDFEISAFTRKESIEEFLKTHQIEILLYGSDITLEGFPIENVKYIYEFTDDPRKESDSGPPTIFKYQPVQTVMTDIIKDYIRKVNETQVKNNFITTNIISLFSPTQSNANLPFAWSISTLLSEQKKVLFIPLDLFPIRVISSLDSSTQSLSEFIYYLKENPNIIVKMKSLLAYSGKLSYLTGITHGFDLLSLTKEDIHKWVEELKLHTDYQTVVFYLGYYSDSTLELMKLSDSILVTTTGTLYGEAVLNEWERQMNTIGIDTNQNKFQRIKLHEEEVLGQAPISLQDLVKSSAWAEAQQYLNYR